MKEQIRKMLDAMGEIVQTTDGLAWFDKKAQIIAQASEEDKTNILEFVGWFEGDDEL